LAFLLAATAPAMMTLLSRRAMPRLAHRDRLPMQWGLDGRPTWYAPRLVALFFAPALATLCLAIPLTLLALLPADIPQADDGRRTLLLIVAVMGFTWIAAHAGYLWGVGRWDRAAPR